MTAALRFNPQRAAAAAQRRFSARKTPLPWHDTTIGVSVRHRAQATIGPAGSNQLAWTTSIDVSRMMRRRARAAETAEKGAAR